MATRNLQYFTTGRFATGWDQGVCDLAQTLGGRTYLCLDQSLSKKQQRLRNQSRFERRDDTNFHDRDYAQETRAIKINDLKTRSKEDALRGQLTKWIESRRFQIK